MQYSVSRNFRRGESPAFSVVCVNEAVEFMVITGSHTKLLVLIFCKLIPYTKVWFGGLVVRASVLQSAGCGFEKIGFWSILGPQKSRQRSGSF